MTNEEMVDQTIQQTIERLNDLKPQLVKHLEKVQDQDWFEKGDTITPELEALARRAVACPRWRWMPGMLGWRPDNQGVPHSIRFVEGVESMEALAGVWPRGGHGVPGLVASGYAICDGYWRSVDITPDLTDPATLGCLLALVREAWSNPDLLVQRDGHLFVVNPTPKGSPPFGDLDALTEAAVLVAALEAAP